MPVSWNTLSSQSEEENVQAKAEMEGWVELDDDIDLPRPPEPPPPFPPDSKQPSSTSFFSGLLGTLSEAWKLTSDIRTEVDNTNSVTITFTNVQQS